MKYTVDVIRRFARAAVHSDDGVGKDSLSFPGTCVAHGRPAKSRQKSGPLPVRGWQLVVAA